MVDYTEIIPMRLKYFREKFQLTQKDISAQLKIKQGSYSNWENGKRLPDINDIARIADIYSTSIDLLLGRTDIKIDEESKKNDIIKNIKNS